MITNLEFEAANRYDICPACNKLTLKTVTDKRPNKLYTYKMERWVYKKCENCNYDTEPRRISG